MSDENVWSKVHKHSHWNKYILINTKFNKKYVAQVCFQSQKIWKKMNLCTNKYLKIQINQKIYVICGKWCVLVLKIDA